MKTQLDELRLGNWIMGTPSKKKKSLKPFQVYEETFCDIKYGFGIYHSIFLNEDILYDCGAIKLRTKSGFEASYKLDSITINRSSFGNFYYKKNVYNTLHQLQNLYYAIEQKELQLDLTA